MPLDGRSNTLDIARAIAILCVIAAHYYHSIFPGSSIGVSIFFALSGYLITAHLLRADTLAVGTLWRFWLRRFLRIYPAYVVTIILALGLMAALEDPRFSTISASVPRFLTMTGRPSSDPALSAALVPGVFWTLFIEFWFYVTLPLVMMVFGRGARLVIALVAIAVLSFLCGLGISPARYLARILPGESFPWICQMIYGSLAAIAARDLQFSIRKDQFVLLSKLWLGLVLFIVVFVSNDDRLLVWPLESNIAAFATAVWLFFYAKSGIDVPDGVIPFIGRISYSLYLVHGLPLDHQRSFPWFDVAFLALSKPWGMIASAFVLAVILYYCVERPGMALARVLTAGPISRGLPGLGAHGVRR